MVAYLFFFGCVKQKEWISLKISGPLTSYKTFFKVGVEYNSPLKMEHFPFFKKVKVNA